MIITQPRSTVEPSTSMIIDLRQSITESFFVHSIRLLTFEIEHIPYFYCEFSTFQESASSLKNHATHRLRFTSRNTKETKRYLKYLNPRMQFSVPTEDMNLEDKPICSSYLVKHFQIFDAIIFSYVLNETKVLCKAVSMDNRVLRVTVCVSPSHFQPKWIYSLSPGGMEFSNLIRVAILWQGRNSCVFFFQHKNIKYSTPESA